MLPATRHCPTAAARGKCFKPRDGTSRAASGEEDGLGKEPQEDGCTSEGLISCFPFCCELPTQVQIFQLVGTCTSGYPSLQVLLSSLSPNKGSCRSATCSGSRLFIISKVICSAAGLKSRIAFLALFMSTRYTLLAFSFGFIFCAVLRERSKPIFCLLQNS